MKKLASALVVLVIALGAIYASGFAPRQMETPSGRLVGQWVETDAGGLPQRDLGARWYFGPVDAGGVGELFVKKGEVTERGTWRVIEDDAGNDQVELELQRPTTGKTVWVVTVDDPGEKANISANALVVKIKVSQLAYVDATTSPEVWSLGELGKRLRRFTGG
jgi:hypothetical protein